MTSWQEAFHHGIAPELGRDRLLVLRDALRSNAPELIQGVTAAANVADIYHQARGKPCVGACAVAYPLWQVGKLQLVSDVFAAFNVISDVINFRLRRATAQFGDFTSWFDAGRREDVFAALLVEVEKALEALP